MSHPKNETQPSLSWLKSHELLHIFGYLDYQSLLKCRLVCPYWYNLIKYETPLIDKFRIKLILNSETVVTAEEPLFSSILNSNMKIHNIILENFLDPGNNIAVYESNKVKISALSAILADMKSEETITEMTVHARDDEPRSNLLLFQLIMKMKRLKVLRLTLPAFVNALLMIVNIDDFVKCNSLQHVEIVHSDFRRLIAADFRRLLQIFPNIQRIDVKPLEAMLLDDNIVHTFGRLIKSIENLELETLSEHLSLSHISYECSTENDAVIRRFHQFLADKSTIETMCLKLLNLQYSAQFFNGRLPQLVNLNLTIRQSKNSCDGKLRLYNILQWTPNLRTLSMKFKLGIEHPIGHKSIVLTSLTHLTVIRCLLNCKKCCNTLLESMVHVKSLKLKPFATRLSLSHLATIANNMKQLECLELFYDDSQDLGNYFEQWPSMPNLKELAVNRVGYINDDGIKNLGTKCPLLETIKLYSLRGYIVKLLEVTMKSFPNIKAVTLRGGRTMKITSLNYIQGKVGWRLRELDVSPIIAEDAIIGLFKNSNFLEIIRCNYGTLVVTRRTYYEVEILKAYNFSSIEESLKHRKRLQLAEDLDSSDGETESNSSDESTDYSESEDDTCDDSD